MYAYAECRCEIADDQREGEKSVRRPRRPGIEANYTHTTRKVKWGGVAGEERESVASREVTMYVKCGDIERTREGIIRRDTP
jgi:hypothetical protein